MPDWPASLLDPAYGDMVRQAVAAGSYEMPWAPLTSSIPGHTATFRVSADALKIAGVRVNVSATIQQQVADILGALLLTPRLLDLMWAERAVTLPPSPQPIAATAAAMVAHSARVDALLAKAGGAPKGGIVQTVGKQWVVSNALAAHPGRAENMGWHFAGPSFGGQTFEASPTLPGVRLIQGPGWAHDVSHLDYSQVCCLVHRDCTVDGDARDLAEVLRDPALAPLATGADGVATFLRQPGVPIFACNRPPASGITMADDGSDGRTVCATPPPAPRSGFPWTPVLVVGGLAAAAAAGAWWWSRARRNPIEPVVLAKRSTGNYRLTLVDDAGSYALRILHTGPYGGGGADVWLEGASSRVEVRRWLRGLRGDADVAQLLADAGYDTYGNALVARPGAVAIGGGA